MAGANDARGGLFQSGQAQGKAMLRFLSAYERDAVEFRALGQLILRQTAQVDGEKKP